jgi:ParB family chromosome partitioning protein
LEPLVVAKTPAGYQIIAGERRWRAAKLAGLTDVPAIIRETSPKGMLEMALVENVQRVDLNPLDRAKGFERLQTEFGLSTSEIAVRIGKSVAYVSNSVRLLTLPDALKDGLLSGLISEGHARALAAIDDTNLMVEAYKIILRESGSVRRAEELARRMKHKSKQSNVRLGIRKDSLRIISEEIDKMQEDMQNALSKNTQDGRKTEVKLIRSRRETRVIFKFEGGIEETQDRLKKLYSGLTS